MILYAENPMPSPKKPVDLINKFDKDARHKFNI